jgi:DNA-binding beta-propeller fold protein YncE
VGNTDTGDGRLGGPGNLAIDAAGRLIVADTVSHRVLVFDGSGQFLAVCGGQRSEPGQFRNPTGVAVDGAGHVYVADILNARIQKFRLLAPLAAAAS